MSQFLNLINSVADGNNLPLLSSLTEPIQGQIKEKLGGALENMVGSSQQTVDAVTSAIEQKAPVLTDSINSISKVYRWRNIIVISLTIWGIFMIISRILISNEDIKKHIESTNDSLVGSTGILTLIAYVWFGSIFIVTVLPAIISVTPKLENVLGAVTSIITGLTK